MHGLRPARSRRWISPESWCGRNISAPSTARSRSTGATAVRRSSTRTSSFCSATTNAKSYLLALDSRTGAVRWKADAPAGVTSYSTPLVVETGGKTEIIVNSSVGVSGHDVATGAAAVARRGSQSLPDSHADLSRRRHLHEPRLSQQPVPGDSAGRQGERRGEPRGMEGRRRARRTSRHSFITTG